MPKLALYVPLKAKPGKERDVADFLTSAFRSFKPVSYTHLRAHETPEHLVCRLLLEKKK